MKTSYRKCISIERRPAVAQTQGDRGPAEGICSGLAFSASLHTWAQLRWSSPGVCGPDPLQYFRFGLPGAGF